MRSGLWSSSRSKRVGADPLEAALGRHPQVAGVLRRPAQARVGEAREAARPVALALVEVVADGADQAVVVARHARQRPPEQRVGLALPVGVGGEHGVDPVARAQQRRQALLVDRLAEVEEAPAAPGADRAAARLAHARDAGSGGSASPAGRSAPRLGLVARRSLAAVLLGADADLLGLGLRRPPSALAASSAR